MTGWHSRSGLPCISFLLDSQPPYTTPQHTHNKARSVVLHNSREEYIKVFLYPSAPSLLPYSTFTSDLSLLNCVQLKILYSSKISQFCTKLASPCMNFNCASDLHDGLCEPCDFPLLSLAVPLPSSYLWTGFADWSRGRTDGKILCGCSSDVRHSRESQYVPVSRPGRFCNSGLHHQQPYSVPSPVSRL